MSAQHVTGQTAFSNLGSLHRFQHTTNTPGRADRCWSVILALLSASGMQVFGRTHNGSSGRSRPQVISHFPAPFAIVGALERVRWWMGVRSRKQPPYATPKTALSSDQICFSQPETQAVFAFFPSFVSDMSPTGSEPQTSKWFSRFLFKLLFGFPFLLPGVFACLSCPDKVPLPDATSRLPRDVCLRHAFMTSNTSS